ncbi:unnamed protein product [Rotaria socialis]|uniref:Uncharacterized protein n=2 Tax=Rotaria socialis TaxID=392032 RepID=A0A817NG09_9BILA|nr:unnamed protein product [Rotaria socialis]
MKICFFINRHYPITREQGLQLDCFINEIKTICINLIRNNKTVKDDIIRLENHIESLQNDRIETEKLRTVAELLRPFVKQIRAMMINQHVPDCYYSKSIINTFLLHSQGQSISWEIADFNRDNRQNNFDINTQVNESDNGSYRILWNPTPLQNPIGFLDADLLSVPTEKIIFLFTIE